MTTNANASQFVLGKFCPTVLHLTFSRRAEEGTERSLWNLEYLRGQMTTHYQISGHAFISSVCSLILPSTIVYQVPRKKPVTKQTLVCDILLAPGPDHPSTDVRQNPPF